MIGIFPRHVIMYIIYAAEMKGVAAALEMEGRFSAGRDELAMNRRETGMLVTPFPSRSYCSTGLRQYRQSFVCRKMKKINIRIQPTGCVKTGIGVYIVQLGFILATRNTEKHRRDQGTAAIQPNSFFILFRPLFFSFVRTDDNAFYPADSRLSNDGIILFTKISKTLQFS